MSRLKKKDDNHDQIVSVFRPAHRILETYALPGAGMDFIAWRPGFLYVVEVKNGMLAPSAQALTHSELEAQIYWGPFYFVINSIDVAQRVIERR